MSIARITRTLAVAAGAAALTLTAWVAQSGATADATPVHHRSPVHSAAFVAPVPHKYGANGMRLGLHCETKDMS